ncbi:major allergen Pru ar 1-like isoform X1 [Alnus glutinosa]|uniref:major allergen Pru ar 1-like isoform X1 n=1 Tax=Alnus glutinosa TaxID=3517 RepID=UPI002D77D9DD|nr:major allergen Pru ar 1-like isoform X1 [Alnus glutinosa]
MGVFTYENQVTSPVPPSRFFKAFVLDSDHLLPKILKHGIKEVNVEILEGNGGPGTIKKITFHEGSHLKFLKHRTDGLDKENFTYNYSVVEGGPLSETLEKVSYETKLVASPDGGTIYKISSKYYTKDNTEIKEEQIKAEEEKTAGVFKAVEGYLLANPDAYN